MGKDNLAADVADGTCKRGAGEVKAVYATLADDKSIAMGAWDTGGDDKSVFESFPLRGEGQGWVRSHPRVLQRAAAERCLGAAAVQGRVHHGCRRVSRLAERPAWSRRSRQRARCPRRSSGSRRLPLTPGTHKQTRRAAAPNRDCGSVASARRHFFFSLSHLMSPASAPVSPFQLEPFSNFFHSFSELKLHVSLSPDLLFFRCTM